MVKLKTQIILLAFVVVLLIGWFSWTKYNEVSVTNTSSAVNYSVENIGELDVTSIYYDKVFNSEESKNLFGLTFAKETSLYIFHFKAQVYYDLAQAESKYNEESKSLKVILPKPGVKLLMKDSDYSVDYEYYMVSNSLFIKKDNDKGLKIQKEAIKDVEKEILGKEDIIKSAQESLQTMLEQMYKLQGIEVECEFL